MKPSKIAAGQIAKLRPDIMRDNVVVNKQTYPPVVDDLVQRLHRK